MTEIKKIYIRGKITGTDDGERTFINEDLEFLDDLNDCIESCLYYFDSRF